MPDAYRDLLDRWKRVANVRHASGLLNWDQQVMMPEGGTPARSRQLAALSSVAHDLVVDDELGGLLDAAADGAADPREEAVVREIRRQREREISVPGDLVEELSRTQSEAQGVWEEARAADAFEEFSPVLSDLVDLHRERAEHIDPGKRPYAVMHENGAPYIDIGTVEDLFEELREALVPLIEAAADSDVDLAAPFEGSYDEGTQMALCEDALDLVGYDWERGRLDTAAHPFSSGSQFDARITTRFDESDPLDALTATLHEFGHAAYQLGLPDEEYATPLGQPRSSGVHESQSRFFENHVGRTRAFWERFLPTFRERFPRVEGVTPGEAYEAANRIYPENLVRVEADELTYHMHIVLRFEIEQEFVGGDLDVREIPGRWNDLMEEYLGVRPGTDAEGCLQDIHWSSGFAGFQSYTIGSVLAAQIDAAMREDLDVDGLVREGEFDPIHGWLTENLHRHGQRYRTGELVEEATGEPLTADYFIDYVEGKFGDLYDL